MLIRGITGALFVFTVVVVVLSSFWSMIAFFFLISLLGLVEFYHLRKTQHDGLQISIILLSGILTFLFLLLKSPYLSHTFADVEFEYFVLPLLIIPVIIFDLFTTGQKNFANTGSALFSSLYIAVPFGLMTHLALGNHDTGSYSGLYILYLFILIWSNDTFAYIVGKFFGKTKLWERISPKKTWEGFVGGIVFTCIAFFILLIVEDIPAKIHYFLLPIAIAVFATLGDLSESLLKRQAGVKDSGNLLPGHGGILDRFDGLLLSLPVLFFILELAKLF